MTENEIRAVENEMQDIIRKEKLYPEESQTVSSNSVSSKLPSTPPTTTKFKSTIDQFLLACGESPISREPIKNGRLTVKEELIIYKERSGTFYRELGTQAYALDFWKKHHSDLPILAKLARRFLSIPGTSVPSESAFSISAYVARKERARLSSDNLSYTMFLKDKIASEN